MTENSLTGAQVSVVESFKSKIWEEEKPRTRLNDTEENTYRYYVYRISLYH